MPIDFTKVINIHKKIADTTIAVEEYKPFGLTNNEYMLCLFSYYYDVVNASNCCKIKLITFIKKANNTKDVSDDWNKYDMNYKIEKDNDISIISSSFACNEQIEESLHKVIKEIMEIELDALHSYLFGKSISSKWQYLEKPLKWLKESHTESGLVYLLNAASEAGMFLYNAKIANDYSKLENNIKDTADRKVVGQTEKKDGDKVIKPKIDTTMSLTQEVLSSIAFPRISAPKLVARKDAQGSVVRDAQGNIIFDTEKGVDGKEIPEDKTLNIELDGAFRISYKQ